MKTKPKASRRPAKPKAEPAAPATREGLLAEIGTLLDALDVSWAALRSGKRPGRAPSGIVHELTDKISALDALRRRGRPGSR